MATRSSWLQSENDPRNYPTVHKRMRLSIYSVENGDCRAAGVAMMVRDQER